MSTDQGPDAPSFGDLFDDPDEPLLPVGAPVRPAASPSPAPAEPPVESSPLSESDVTGPEPIVATSVAEPGTEAGPNDAEVVDLDEPTDAEGPDDEPDPLPADSLEPPAPAPHEPVPDQPIAEEPASDDQAGAAPLAAVAAMAGGITSAPERPWDGHVDPAVSSAPATRVDTGRLYRSAGAEGPATLGAIPAIDPAYLSARRGDPDVLPAAPAPASRPGGSGLTYTGVAVVVVASTVLVALADALINDRIGALTGAALAVSSIYAAAVVRRPDIWAAVVVPPLAFLAAALTAGQLTLDSSGSLLIREGYMLFRTLAVNAPWILGTTAVCLVIVLVRRRRA